MCVCVCQNMRLNVITLLESSAVESLGFIKFYDFLIYFGISDHKLCNFPLMMYFLIEEGAGEN